MTKSTTDLKKDLKVQERTVKLRELLEKKWKELPDNIGVGRLWVNLKPDDFEEAGFENIHQAGCASGKNGFYSNQNPDENGLLPSQNTGISGECDCYGELHQYKLSSQYEIYQCRSCGQYLGALANRDLGYTFEDRNDWQRWKQQCFPCYQNFDKKTDDDIQTLNRNLTAKIEDAIVILNKHTSSIDELNNGFDNEKNENRLDELEAKIDELNDIAQTKHLRDIDEERISQLEASMRIVAQTEHACESEDEDSPIATAHNRIDKIGENISAILDRIEALEKKR